MSYRCFFFFYLSVTFVKMVKAANPLTQILYILCTVQNQKTGHVNGSNIYNYAIK